MPFFHPLIAVMALSPSYGSLPNEADSVCMENRKDSTYIPAGLRIKPSESRYAAAKTNALLWCGTIMNIAGEIQLSSKMSFSLPVMWCPWFISDSRSLRVLAFQPEGRWWLDAVGNGHFIGVHASVGWYNLKNGNYRYQDAGHPALGGGISYGYVLHLGSDWDIEFSIGAGILSLRYDRFYNIVNGMRADTRKTLYWGLDHAGISVAYHFNL